MASFRLFPARNLGRDEIRIRRGSGGPGAIRTHDSRIESPELFRWASPADLPEKQETARRRPSPCMRCNV
jgi:hypothetical protein